MYSIIFFKYKAVVFALTACLDKRNETCTFLTPIQPGSVAEVSMKPVKSIKSLFFSCNTFFINEVWQILRTSPRRAPHTRKETAIRYRMLNKEGKKEGSQNK